MNCNKTLSKYWKILAVPSVLLGLGAGLLYSTDEATGRPYSDIPGQGDSYKNGAPMWPEKCAHTDKRQWPSLQGECRTFRP